MRLINSRTWKLEERSGDDVPPYAILSHTWGKEEVSFQDMQGSGFESKLGWGKITRCCEIARSDGFQYIWVDTCCIDKASSSELSEAINSMYQFYQNAEVCYVFLADVSRKNHHNSDIWESNFSQSRWFTRGWTLQELIAPSNLVFYSQNWEDIGTKSSLQKVIQKATGINAHALSHNQDLTKFSVAQKMSWASKRETTRTEDLAYCLMGIFNVNMPMLYGEGHRAFLRLQEEIIKSSDDSSIFAWKAPRAWEYPRGLLAKSPSLFKESGNIVRGSTKRCSVTFALTNKGLHLQLDTISVGTVAVDCFALLECHEIENPYQLLGIYLAKGGQKDSHEYFYRVHRDAIRYSAAEPFKLERKNIYVEEEWNAPYQDNSSSYNRRCFIRLSGLGSRRIETCTRELIGNIQKWIITGEDTHKWTINDEPILHHVSPGVIELEGIKKDGFTVLVRLFEKPFVPTPIILAISADVENLYPIVSDGAALKHISWANGSDRSTWQLPFGKGLISVAIRRQLIHGMKTRLVDVTYVDSDP